MSMQDFKCPACGGHIEFNSTSQNMKCPYCDSEFDIDAVQAYNNAVSAGDNTDIQWHNDAGQSWGDGETNGMRVFSCKSCGGELICDANTGATECPYCGSPVVLSGTFSDALKPDYVIPFKLDKAAAKSKFKEAMQGKKLLPKVFQDENHIEEIKGVYVPFWLFDASVDADMVYKATKVRTWSDSNFNYTDTSYYSVSRAGNLDFHNVAIDGSSQMDDALMESLEPFDMSQAVDFQTAYLSGYLADKYDVDAETSKSRANQRIQSSTVDAFARTLTGYSSVQVQRTDLQVDNSQVKYALYPIWVLTTKWNGKNYLFAMNGQTGKSVQNFPVDEAAAKKMFFINSVACAAVVFGITLLLQLL